MTINIRRSHTITLDHYGRHQVTVSLLDCADDAALDEAAEALSTMHLPRGTVRQSKSQILDQLQRARRRTSRRAGYLEWEHEGHHETPEGYPTNAQRWLERTGHTGIPYREDTSGAQVIIHV